MHKLLVFLLLLLVLPLPLAFAHDGIGPIPPGIDTTYNITLPVGIYADYAITHFPLYNSAGFEILNITRDFAKVYWYVKGQIATNSSVTSNGTIFYSIGPDSVYFGNNITIFLHTLVPVLDKPFIAAKLQVQDQITFYAYADRITRIGVAEFLGNVRKVAVEENLAGGYSVGWDWETGLLLYVHTGTMNIDIIRTNAFSSYINMVNFNPTTWIYIIYFIALTLIDYYLYILLVVAIFILYKYLPSKIKDLRHKHKPDHEAERVLKAIEIQEENVTID